MSAENSTSVDDFTQLTEWFESLHALTTDPSGIPLLTRFLEIANDVLDGILRLYDQDKVTQAHGFLTSFKAHLMTCTAATCPRDDGEEKQLTCDVEALTAQLVAIKRRVDEEMRLQALETEIVEIDLVLARMETDDGWTLVKESERMKTWYRHDGANPIHSIKIEAILNVPLFNLLAIVNEVDLYVDWVPFLKESRETLVLGKYRRGAYMHFGLPWPLSDRDASIYAYGIDQLLDKHQLLIVVRSVGRGYGGDGEGETGGVYAERLEQAAPSETSARVRMDLRLSGGLLSPISETQCRFVVMANADPKMAIVPYWLLNYVTKQLGGILVGRLETLAVDLYRDPHSKFHQRIQEKPQIYADIQQRVNQYLQTQNQSSSSSSSSSEQKN